MMPSPLKTEELSVMSWWCVCVMSDTVERPCDQLPTPAQHRPFTSQLVDHSANRTEHQLPSSSSNIVNEKYISDRDLPQSRRTDTNSALLLLAIPTVTLTTFYFVLSAVFHSLMWSPFWHQLFLSMYILYVYRLFAVNLCLFHNRIWLTGIFPSWNTEQVGCQPISILSSLKHFNSVWNLRKA